VVFLPECHSGGTYRTRFCVFRIDDIKRDFKVGNIPLVPRQFTLLHGAYYPGVVMDDKGPHYVLNPEHQAYRGFAEFDMGYGGP